MRRRIIQTAIFDESMPNYPIGSLMIITEVITDKQGKQWFKPYLIEARTLQPVANDCEQDQLLGPEPI